MNRWGLTKSLTRWLFCPVAELFVHPNLPVLHLHPTLTHFTVKTTLAECCREDFSHYFFPLFFPAAPRLAFLTIDLISQIFLQLVTLIWDTRCCFKLQETEARMEISRLSHRSPSVMYDIHSHNVSVWKRTVGLSHVRGNLAACRLHSAGSLTAVAWFGAHASYSTVNGGRSELFCSLAGCRRLCVRHFYICRGDICR